VVVVDDDGDALEPVEPLIEGPGLLTREEELRRAVVAKVGVEYDEAQKAAEAGIQRLLEETRRSSSGREGMQFNREQYSAVVPSPRPLCGGIPRQRRETLHRVAHRDDQASHGCCPRPSGTVVPA